MLQVKQVSADSITVDEIGPLLGAHLIHWRLNQSRMLSSVPFCTTCTH